MFSRAVRSDGSVRSHVGSGQQLSWKNKTNPGPNRQAGLIKHSRGRGAFWRTAAGSTPSLYFARFLCTFATFLWIYYFFMNYLNMAISHLQLVFKEKATGENNHKLNSLRTAPVLAGHERPVPVSESPLAVASQTPFHFKSLGLSLHGSPNPYVQHGRHANIRESLF